MCSFVHKMHFVNEKQKNIMIATGDGSGGKRMLRRASRGEARGKRGSEKTKVPEVPEAKN